MQTRIAYSTTKYNYCISKSTLNKRAKRNKIIYIHFLKAQKVFVLIFIYFLFFLYEEKSFNIKLQTNIRCRLIVLWQDNGNEIRVFIKFNKFSCNKIIVLYVTLLRSVNKEKKTKHSYIMVCGHDLVNMSANDN